MDPRLTSALEGRYTIDREIGAGGMATVYLAHDSRHDRNIAIKVLHPDLGAVLGSDRFLTEIRTTAKLQHPHILPLLDSGSAGGLLYFVMTYETGETLRARLARERLLPVADALRIGREVAWARDARFQGTPGVSKRPWWEGGIIYVQNSEDTDARFLRFMLNFLARMKAAVDEANR